MYRNKKSTVFAVMLTGILLVVFCSCKKQAEAVDDKMNILTSGKWRLTGFTAYTIMGTVDVYASYSACQKDDLLGFNKDGTAVMDEGPSKCDAADPQSFSVQWKFLNDARSRINIDGTEFIVDKLENNEFRISTPRTDPYEGQSVIAYTR